MTTGDMATPCYLDDVLDTARLAPERPRPLRRTEYERLVEAGSFVDERIELLEGVLVSMSPQGTEHADLVSRLAMIFMRLMGDRVVIRSHSPFAASDDSEPEPDLALVPPGDYRRTHPTQAFLIVEVAESSLRKDSGIKAGLYARSHVAEYWIVDLNARSVIVHGASDGSTYQRRFSASRTDSLSLDVLGGGALAISEFLGPA
jgi:Uma2 family endonuclease